MSPAPNLFIVGAMRAGTTSVYSWLSQHPSVHVSVPKEPHWFAFPDVEPTYTGPGDDQLNARIVWRHADYQALFAGAADAAYRAEASAMYLHLPHAIDRLLAARPGECATDSRFVVALRDPVERTVSAFSYNRMREREPLEHLRDALDAEDQRRADGWSPMFWYQRASQVADQVERLLDLAPDRTFLLSQADLSDAPAETAERLFRWLELSVPAELDTSARNRSGEARSAALDRLLRHGPVKRRLKPLVPAAVRHRIERVRERNRQRSDVLDDGTRTHLADLLDDERQRMAQLLARPLSD